MLDISGAQVLVSLETDSNGTTVADLIMRLTADRYVSDPIGKRESCLLVYRLELLSSSGECCNQRLEPRMSSPGLDTPY